MFLQISFTYARKRSGPNTLPCGTPDEWDERKLQERRIRKLVIFH
jgi:hypothetical protein